MTMRYRVLMAALIAGLAATPISADEAPISEPITLGTSYVVETHGAVRRINVLIPPGYERDDARYPLLLILDGGREQDLFLTHGMTRWNQLWQRSAPVIFVGIETVDRQRELLPPTSDEAERARYPTAGESAEFRRWLSDEILPMLRATYRDDGRAFLLGESAAGHFVAETWAVQPELFNGYAAISPSLHWSGQALAERLEGTPEQSRPPLYISLANEGGATEMGIERLVAAAGEKICFSDRRKELVHANALHGLFPEALQYLLPTGADWLEEFGLTLRCNNRME